MEHGGGDAATCPLSRLIVAVVSWRVAIVGVIRPRYKAARVRACACMCVYSNKQQTRLVSAATLIKLAIPRTSVRSLREMVFRSGFSPDRGGNARVSRCINTHTVCVYVCTHDLLA